MKGMAADFQSLRAISGMVNTILGIITLLLAYRTKNNSWSELLAAKLLGCFLLFHGILMTTAYIAGFFTVGSFAQSFFGSLVNIAHTILYHHEEGRITWTQQSTVHLLNRRSPCVATTLTG